VNELLALVIEALVIVLDGLLAIHEITSSIRRVWCPPSRPSVHPLYEVAEALLERPATSLRAIAPRGHRRAAKAVIAAALVAMV
jgi:hypothetical protein